MMIAGLRISPLLAALVAASWTLAGGVGALAQEPGDEAPKDEAPVDEAPVDEAAVDEVPKDEAPKVVKRDRLGDPLPDGAVMRLGTLRYRSSHDLPALAFAPRGKLMANGSKDNKIEVWNTATGSRILALEIQTGMANAVAFDPKGQVLAVGSDGAVDLWSVPEGKHLGTMEAVGYNVRSLAFSPDGRQLAVAGASHAIGLWDVARRAKLGAMEGHTGDVTAVAFSDRGKVFASGSRDGTVKLWRLSRTGGTPSLSIDAHGGLAVTALALTPDGSNVISGGGDGIRLWDTRKGELAGEFDGHEDTISALSVSSNGQLFASAADDDKVFLWSINDNQPLHAFVCRAPGAVSFDPEGEKLAAGGAGISLWDVSTGVDMLGSFGHRLSARAVRFLKDNRTVASAGLQREVFLWEATTGQTLQTLENPGLTSFVAVSPNGKFVATGGDGEEVQIWDVTARAVTLKLGPHRKPLTGLEFSSDGRRVASSSLDGLLRIWDARTGELLRQISGEGGFVRAMAFSPDSRTLVTVVSQGWFVEPAMAVWHVDTGALMLKIPTGAASVLAVAFSADGKQLATGHKDGVIALWDVASASQLMTLQGHSSHVRSLAFGPQGNRLASGSTDKTVRVWDLASGEQLKSFEGHTDIVYAVDFSPKGDQLVSASGDSTLLIWEAP